MCWLAQHWLGVVNTATLIYLLVTLGKRNERLAENNRLIKKLADLMIALCPGEDPAELRAKRKAKAIDIWTREPV